jgi:hypothetical protein
MLDFYPVRTLYDPETGEPMGNIPADADPEPYFEARRMEKERNRLAARLNEGTFRCDEPDRPYADPESERARQLLAIDYRSLQMESDHVLEQMANAAHQAKAPNPPRKHCYRTSPYYTGAAPRRGHFGDPLQETTHGRPEH